MQGEELCFNSFMPEAQLWGGPNDPSRSPNRSDEGCGGGTHCLGGADKSWVSLGGTKLNVASATSGLVLRCKPGEGTAFLRVSWH